MTLPRISMDPKVKYTVATGAYQRLLIGRPLTDRKILQLMKAGFYGKAAKERAEQRAKRTNKVFVETVLSQLLD